ncbi:hypothetical protein CGH73_26960 [Vibrio parahaemolyticus]|nr:hypothetical protein CGH73_26960 [Vibrio parahaemolyticus]
MIQKGEFPKPIKFGRSSRWFKSEVEQWLNQQISASRGEAPIDLKLKQVA